MLKIDRGSPSKYDVSGIKKRVNSLNKIKQINFKKALDLGMGRGAYIDELSNYGGSLFGLDVNIEFLEEYQNRKKHEFSEIIQGSGEFIPFKNKSVDTVFLIEVIEHVEKLDITIKELNRILTENGFLYITVPNNYFPLESHNVHLGKWELHGKYIPFVCSIEVVHKLIGTARRFTIKSLDNVLGESGFTNVGYSYIYPPLDYSKKLQRILGPLLRKLESSLFRIFGQTIIAVYQKAST